MEAKYKMMTEQLRLTHSDEEVGNYLRWIITSDTAKEYWKNNLLNQGAVMPSLPNDRKKHMRKQATTIFELTKGFTGEPTDNTMKAALEMAGYVQELTTDVE